MWTMQIRDQTACSVQSGLDLHCPQKFLKSLTVREELRVNDKNLPAISVHGAWSQWIFSTVCSVTCGNGTQERYRLCDNPPRSNYGNDCEGNSTETVDCIQVPCQGKLLFPCSQLLLLTFPN